MTLPTSNEDSGKPGMKQRVLIVDDEPSFTRMVKLNLERTGEFEVMEENDATNAMKVAREFKPNIILLDLIMPLKDGGELRTMLKNDPELGHIPVLFVTATVSAREAGRHGLPAKDGIFLGKPITVETLVRCIKENLPQPPTP